MNIKKVLYVGIIGLSSFLGVACLNASDNVAVTGDLLASGVYTHSLSAGQQRAYFRDIYAEVGGFVAGAAAAEQGAAMPQPSLWARFVACFCKKRC